MYEITIKTQVFLFDTFIVCCLHQIVTISYSKMIKLEVFTLENCSDLGLESLNFARLTRLCLLLRIVLVFRNSFKRDRTFLDAINLDILKQNCYHCRIKHVNNPRYFVISITFYLFRDKLFDVTHNIIADCTHIFLSK